MSVRLYEPSTRQWTIRWANARDGDLGEPMVGGFADGVGTFHNQERFGGRPVLVRFIFSDISTTSFRLEQAFSADGGRSWEPNWIARFERAGADAHLSAIEATWRAIDAAWNARDAARFSALYADAASFEFVNEGPLLNGRDAIRRHFVEQFRRTAPPFSHHTTIRSTRQLADGVIAVDGVVQVMRASSDGGAAAVYHRFMIYGVMVRSGDAWRIDSLRIFQMP